MRVFDSNTLNALSSDTIIVREMVYIGGKDNSGSPKSFGFWNGEDDVSISVVSLADGTTVSRTYIGGGSLNNIGVAPGKVGLDVRTIQIEMSRVHSGVIDMVRGNDIRNAVVETHKVLFDTTAGQVIGPAYGEFFGEVNGAPINTPARAGTGSVMIKCVSVTRELTFTNTALKSDETQKLRSGDRFYKYTGVAPEWPIFWGEAQESVASTPPKKTGLFGWGWGPF